jgi:hypothetical protein
MQRGATVGSPMPRVRRTEITPREDTAKMLDHVIPAPKGLDLYACHRLVEGLTGGTRPLFALTGEGLLVRTDAPVTPTGAPIKKPHQGEIRVFELDGCCYIKTRGHRRYLPIGEHAARRDWLDRKALVAGFRVLVAHSHARRVKVKDAMIDRTTFVGVLEVTDAATFNATLHAGLPGAGARAFGFGLLRI